MSRFLNLIHSHNINETEITPEVAEETVVEPLNKISTEVSSTVETKKINKTTPKIKK